MKMIVVGGTGTIGLAVVDALKQDGNHDVISVGFSNGAQTVDITSVDSIQEMYQSIGKFDALISTIGKVNFKSFVEMDSQDYLLGLDNKLMGQIRLVVEGMKYIGDQGSFTLTSGILNEQPILGSTSAAMVNSALEGFARSSALEMPRGIRINVVSPTVVTESLEIYGSYFKGFESVSAERVALAYVKSVFGIHNGAVYQVGR